MFQIDYYKYDSANIIGKGTFSTVYSCQKTGYITSYAIKKVDNKIKEIDNEIRIHSRLKHENIVEFVDVIYKETHTYIITKLCEDGTLLSYIERFAPIKEPAIIDFVGQIANALKYLYDKGIMHRDLKPDNILLHGDTIKLADFSLATEFHDDSTIFSEVCGSPAYMAPEIKRNRIYSNRSDLWSLGLIIHQMRYGLLAKIEHNKRNNDTELDELMNGLLEENQYKRISWRDFFENDLIEPFLDKPQQLEYEQDSEYITEEEEDTDPEDFFLQGLIKSKPINIVFKKNREI